MKASELSTEEKAKTVNGLSFFGMYNPLSEEGNPIRLLDGGTGINFEQLFGDIYETTPEINCRFSRKMLNKVIKHYYSQEKLEENEKELACIIKKILTERCGGKEFSPGCFPSGILIGASWNPEIAYETGKALGKEAAVFGIDILLGTPNINILRDPLAGRLFEGYSEDPALVSGTAPELIKGVQEYGVAANVKHFAANNQEMNRTGINEIISRRALEEIYLPGFRACVSEGNARTVMSAYNKINGVPCTESSFLLKQKLKNEWNSDAAVMSDWGAVTDQIKSIKAGNALKMPGPSDTSAVINAVNDGILSEEDLDSAADDLIRLSMWIKENSRKKEIQSYDYSILKHETDEAAYQAASEGIVLLENQNRTLPLSAETGEKICICGTSAENFLYCGSGSAGVITDRKTDLKECLKQNLLSADFTSHPENSGLIIFAAALEGMEGNDRKDLYLKTDDLEKLYMLGALIPELMPPALKEQFKDIKVKKITGKIILVLNICGPADLSFINREVIHAVICTFIPGMQGPAALADILTGKINPSGKLPLTFPLKYEDAPSFINFPGDGYEVCYGEGIFNGYRYYDTKKIKPLYHFGYGLSYTQFKLGTIRNLKTGENITFDIDIENSGQYSGAEVIQIYVSDPFSALRKPEKELKKFRKVFLKPGEKRNIKFSIPLNDLRSFDSDLKQWTLEEGFYDIIAAVSSSPEDVYDKKRIFIDTVSPYSYGIDSTVKTVYENSGLLNVFMSFWNQECFDPTIPDSNYQYTPSRKISEIIRETCNNFDPEKLSTLNEKMRRISKK